MSPHRQAVYKAAHPSFVTCNVLGATPVFNRPEPAQKVLDAWRLLQEQGRLTIYAYVLLEDHLHLLASADDLAKLIEGFQSAAARQILDLLESLDLHGMVKRLKRCQDGAKTDVASQFWEAGAAPEPVKSGEMMRAKLEFIHNNPVKRGYVADPTHYRYSSARNYAGQPGLLPVTTDW
jgi:putative transposase